ncbi:Signal peptide peptidase-like 2 [Bienertia sinuspersici]
MMIELPKNLGVKVQTWIDDKEDEEFVGVGARFTTKANVAQAAGASAVLIVNDQNELYKMVCEPDETDLNIHIPAVMLPQDAGRKLEKMLSNGSSVSVQLYSPRRPVVDIAEVFLWLMAVGTVLCASYWSAWSAREADASDELSNVTSTGGGEHQHSISPIVCCCSFLLSCRPLQTDVFLAY